VDQTRALEGDPSVIGAYARPRRVRVLLGVAVCTALLLVGIETTSHTAERTALAAQAEPNRSKIFAKHDATVIEARPELNTGDWRRLRARSNPDQITFVKFWVPERQGSIGRATLRLHIESDVGTRVRVHRTKKAWTEQAITWNTAPDVKRAFGKYDIKPGQQWLDVDVSAYVDGPGGYSFAVVGLRKAKAVFGSTEADLRPRLLVYDPPLPQNQPDAPITAAFMYPWFPNAWDQGGTVPFSQFTPARGMYDSADPEVIDEQVTMATGAGIEAFIASWWGPGHHTDSATQEILDRIPQSPNPNFRIAVYYEEEGQSDPSAGEIRDDLEYLRRLFDEPAYLRVDGKPVVFVWAESSDGAGMASRWNRAKDLFGDDLFVVLKVFSGYRDVADQPDSWHQYGPANNYSEHLPHSAVVSPGFWHAEESSPRLSRSPSRFREDVRSMASSGAFWQLVTTWNEWGEGTIVEPAREFGTTYLDILADELNAGGGLPPPTTTTTAAPPPGALVTFAAGGDFGATANTDATLSSVASGDAEFLLALGDLSYDDASPSEWCSYVKSHLGSSFPVELLVGNHEDDDRVDGYILDFASCLPDRMGAVGVYAAEYYFDVDGLARFIMVGAGNDVEGEKYDYEIGNAHYDWLERTIDDARADGIPWVIVGMHKPCITAGNKSCEVGTDVYDLLIDKRVDLILHGHDHDYQRSKQLTCAVPDTYDADCVADHGGDGRYSKGAGSVFAIVGNTGGGGLTSVDTDDSEIRYLAAWHGADSPDPGRGYLLVSLDGDRLTATFVGSTTSFSDSFTIE
jgi:hypothetical protein